MRRVFGLAIVAALLLATAARAQLINDLEKRLDGAKGAAPALTIPMPGYLGMVPDEEYKGDDGVKVVSVKPGGPADASGLKPGDLITSIDDKPIRTVDAMDAALTTASAGQKLKIAVRRAGGPQTLTVTLGSRPSATPAADVGEAPPAAAPPTLNPPTTSPFDPLTPPAATPPAPAASGPIRSKPLDPLAPPAAAPPAETPAASPPAADPLGAPAASSPAAPGGGASLGITVVPLSDEARAAYGLSLRSGALITAVKPGSPADRAGLPLGGVIAMIDGRRIGTADELVSFVRAARPGQEVELGYYQGEVLRRKLVTLAPAASAAIPAAPAVTGGQPPIFGNDRPILNRVERMVEGVAGGRGPSTVFDPSELATLKIQVLDLTAQVKALEERLKRLEGGGAAPPAPAPGLGGFTPAP